MSLSSRAKFAVLFAGYVFVSSLLAMHLTWFGALVMREWSSLVGGLGIMGTMWSSSPLASLAFVGGLTWTGIKTYEKAGVDEGKGIVFGLASALVTFLVSGLLLVYAPIGTPAGLEASLVIGFVLGAGWPGWVFAGVAPVVYSRLSRG